MYLPNPELHATGFEPAEFIDAGGDPPVPPTGRTAYLRVRVDTARRANGSVTVYLPDGTALAVRDLDLVPDRR
jgi:hypothetical protein